MYQWLLDHTDSLVATANFTAVVFLLLLSVVTLVLLKRDVAEPESDIRIILWGVVVEAMAWALHRTYWGSWRIAREYRYEDWNAWFVQHGYLAILPSFMVLVGLAMILSPLWRSLRSPLKYRTKIDYFIPAGLILGVYVMLWVWIEDETKVDPKTFSSIPPVIISKELNNGRGTQEPPRDAMPRANSPSGSGGHESLGTECCPPIPERQQR